MDSLPPAFSQGVEHDQVRFLQLLQGIIVATNKPASTADMLQVCLGHICAATPWQLAQVYLTTAVPGVLTPSVWHGGDSQQYAPLRTALSEPLTMGGSALSDKLVWTASLAASDARYAKPALAAGVQSACTLPLVVGPEVVGLIELFSTQAQQPDPALQEILTQVGLLIGAAVERTHVIGQLRANETQLYAILDNCPGSIYVKDEEGRYLFVNQVFEQWFGAKRADVLGKTDYDLISKEIADQWRANDHSVMAGQKPVEEEETALFGGELRTFFSIKFPLRNLQGAIYATAGITTDITDRKHLEEEQTQLREQMIQLQAATLAELSTPLIPITDRVMVMPLIGAMDSQRAQQVLATVLQGAEVHQAEAVILDITGVPVVDTAVAGILISAAQALKLVGSRTIITGIRPEVAQTIVGLGLDLSQMTTAATLQSGISVALGQFGAGVLGQSEAERKSQAAPQKPPATSHAAAPARIKARA